MGVTKIKTSIEDLERTYDKPDPWGYQSNNADIERKRTILDAIWRIRRDEFSGIPELLVPSFERALDLGCGEGWITKDLPAKEIWGYEESKQAQSRWDSTIKDLNLMTFHVGYVPQQFDLIIATGVLYENYDWQFFVDMFNLRSADKAYIVTSNICGREYWPAIDQIKAQLIHLEEFPYHRGPDEMFTQRLRIYKR